MRATVRTRRWYMEQLDREVTMQTAPLKLYLSEDFHEAARAFAEKRRPGPFKAPGDTLDQSMPQRSKNRRRCILHDRGR